jgi:hypothetical protein
MMAQTYTGRTQWITTAYALLRKCLMYIVGLGRVELPTSRLSGPPVRKQSMAMRGDFTPVQTSRHFRREKEKAQKPPPTRTQRVHTKIRGSVFGGSCAPSFLTNPLLGLRFSKEAQFERERVARKESSLVPGISLSVAGKSPPATRTLTGK